MRKFISELLLIIVTIIWGLAFIWQNIASKVLGPLTVVGIRSVIAVVFLGAVALLIPSLYRSQDPKILAEPITKNSTVSVPYASIIKYNFSQQLFPRKYSKISSDN